MFPEYDSLFSDTFGVTSKEPIAKYPTPEYILSVPTGKLTKLLGKASLGRFGKQKAEQLKSMASGSSSVSFAKDAFAFHIRQLVEQPNLLETQIGELKEQLAVLLGWTSIYIITIPGIGEPLEAIILSEF